MKFSDLKKHIRLIENIAIKIYLYSILYFFKCKVFSLHGFIKNSPNIKKIEMTCIICAYQIALDITLTKEYIVIIVSVQLYIVLQ